jgi:DNA-binding CsgD family transcriptional regulator
MYLAAILVFVLTYRLPTDVQFYPNAAALLAVSAFPILWFKRWFFPAFGGTADQDIDEMAVGRLCRAADLTPRECELVKLVLQGKSNSDIERSLFISVHTVKNHLTSIYLKLGVKNRMQLVGRFQALRQSIQIDLRLADPSPREAGPEIRPS